MEVRSDVDVQIARHTWALCASFRVAKLACDMKVTVGISAPAADQQIEIGSALPPTLRSLTRLSFWQGSGAPFPALWAPSSHVISFISSHRISPHRIS